MRVTKGEHVRRYVYDMKCGRVQVKRLMRGRRQLWPTDEERVANMALDLNLPDGSIAGAYWQHALNLVGSMSSERCYMRLIAGEREYNLQTTYGVFNRAVLEHGEIDFGNKGPLAGMLRVGDMVKVEVRVPQHVGVTVAAVENQRGEGVTELPWLPGTFLRVRVTKGRKRASAGCRFEVSGEPSERVHIRGYAQKNGHCRGTYWGEAKGPEMRVINGIVQKFDDVYEEGDTGVKVCGEWYGAGSGELVPVFPAFSWVFNFKVTALTVKRVNYE